MERFSDEEGGVIMNLHTLNPNMLNLITPMGYVICKFEKFESGKAFDWLTSKGYKVTHKETIPYMIWTLEKL